MAFDIKNYLTPPVLLIIFLLIISFTFIFPVLNMIVLGAILAYGVRPVALKIQSRIKYSSVSIIIAIIVILIPLILLIGYLSFEIYTFVNTILSSNYSLDVDTTMSQIAAYLPVDINSIDSYLNSAINHVGTFILNYSVKFFGKFANIILDLFILICSVFSVDINLSP